MESVNLKIGRNVYTITEKDLILDNGSILQLITKQAGSGWNSYYPPLSKKLTKELISKELLIRDEVSMKYEQTYPSYCKVYRFNIAKMLELGY